MGLPALPTGDGARRDPDRYGYLLHGEIPLLALSPEKADGEGFENAHALSLSPGTARKAARASCSC